MSRTAIIVVLLIAAAMGVAAFLALRPGGGKGATGPLLEGFDIGSVERIEVVSVAGDRVEIALSDRAPGVWVMSWRDGAGVERSWPAAGSRVRGALRLLADLRCDASASAEAGRSSTRVVLRGAGGIVREIGLSSSALAGKTRVWVDGTPRAALGDSALLEVFAVSGVEAWREPSLFGTEVSDASRLSIAVEGREIGLSRVGRSWGLLAPRSGPADEPVVTTVMNALASSAVRTFLSRSSPEYERAMGRSTARIIVETTRRGTGPGQPERWTVVQSVTVGGAADVGGTALFATLEAHVEDPASRTTSKLWGPVAVTVDRDAVNAVPADVGAYISRIALRTPAPDIRALVFGDEKTDTGAWTARRGAASWTIGDAPAPGRISMMLDTIIKTLTEERASTVKVEGNPEGFTIVINVAAASLDGRSREEFVLAVAPAGPNAKSLAVRSGGVWRTYVGGAGSGIAEWLRSGARPGP